MATSEDTGIATAPFGDTIVVDTPADGEGSTGGGPCHSDEDCGTRHCEYGVCTGCTTNADCAAGEWCWYEDCRSVADVPACVMQPAPVCGDGVLGALEECEAGLDCSSCRDAGDPETWIVGAELDRMTLLPDGGVATIGGARNDLVRWTPNGDVAWTASLPHPAAAVAIDTAGNAYVVGGYDFSEADVAYAPWIASWDPDGASRWSFDGTSIGSAYDVTVVDGGVIVVGAVEQANSPSGRGWIASYDADGAEIWARKVSSVASIGRVVPLAGGIAGAALGLAGFGQRTLLRFDPEGNEIWSTDVWTSGSIDQLTVGLASGGDDGSVWFYGAQEGGAWAVRFGANGEEIERLDCLGATLGHLSHLDVAPDGRLAAAVTVDDDVLGLPLPLRWLAVVEGGAIVAAQVLGDYDAVAGVFGLGWRPNGTIAVGVESYATDETRILEVNP